MSKKKECEVRWQETTPDGAKVPVVCGHELPCPEHTKDKTYREVSNLKRDIELEQKIKEVVKKYREAGGDPDFYIISKSDHDRNWRNACLKLLPEDRTEDEAPLIGNEAFIEGYNLALRDIKSKLIGKE